MFCRNNPVYTLGMFFFMRITLYLQGECHVLWESPYIHLQGKNENEKNHPVFTWKMNIFVEIYLRKLHVLRNHNVTTYRKE